VVVVSGGGHVCVRCLITERHRVDEQPQPVTVRLCDLVPALGTGGEHDGAVLLGHVVVETAGGQPVDDGERVPAHRGRDGRRRQTARVQHVVPVGLAQILQLAAHRLVAGHLEPAAFARHVQLDHVDHQPGVVSLREPDHALQLLLSAGRRQISGRQPTHLGGQQVQLTVCEPSPGGSVFIVGVSEAVADSGFNFWGEMPPLHAPPPGFATG